MAQKFKIIVNKKSPKGIVNIFGNIQNKVGTYDKDKLEKFKNKLKEKSIELEDKVCFILDQVENVITIATDNFYGKAADSYDKIMSKYVSSKEITGDNSKEQQIEELNEHTVMTKIIPTRSINFEDLEPLGKIIDEEDDIYELKELKMELLFREQEDISKESDVIRKK